MCVRKSNGGVLVTILLFIPGLIRWNQLNEDQLLLLPSHLPDIMLNKCIICSLFCKAITDLSPK